MPTERRPGIAWRSRVLPRALLLALCLAIVGSVAFKTWRNAVKPGGDIDYTSLAVARCLGGCPDEALTGTASSAQGRFSVMPGYPLLLRGLAAVDPSLVTAFSCTEANAQACPKASFRTLFLLQALLSVASFTLAAAVVLALTGSPVIAGLTVALYFLAVRSGEYAGIVRPHVVFQFLVMLFTLLAVHAAQLRDGWRRALATSLAAGLAAAAAAAFEPYAIAMVPAAALAIALTPSKAGQKDHWRALVATSLLVGAVTGVVAIAELAIGLGYDPDNAVRHVAVNLTQRLTTNHLDTLSWLVALILPVPVIGPAIEHGLVPVDMARRMGLHVPQSAIYVSHVDFDRLVAESRSATSALLALMHQGMIAQTFRYIAGLVPTLGRGFWAAADLVALLGVLHLGRMMAYARVDGTRRQLRAVAWPAMALLVANALLTFNFALYNPIIPFMFAFAIAYVAAGW